MHLLFSLLLRCNPKTQPTNYLQRSMHMDSITTVQEIDKWRFYSYFQSRTIGYLNQRERLDDRELLFCCTVIDSPDVGPHKDLPPLVTPLLLERNTGVLTESREQRRMEHGEVGGEMMES